MDVLLFVALAFPLGCLALICCLALIGVLMLAGAFHGVGAIKASVGKAGSGLLGSSPHVNLGKDSGTHRGMITRTAEWVFGALLYLTEKYGGALRTTAPRKSPGRGAAGHH